MNFWKISLASIIVFFLVGCAASGTASTVKQESAVIESEKTEPFSSSAVAPVDSVIAEEPMDENPAVAGPLEDDVVAIPVEPSQPIETVSEPDTNYAQPLNVQEQVQESQKLPSESQEGSSIAGEMVMPVVEPVQSFVDPQVAIPTLVQTIFDKADSLYRQGLVDSAIAYVDRFRIIKPLWISWENTADSLRNKYGEVRAVGSKKFEPLVLEIQNMNRVHSAYSMVAAVADSLIALFPGDSLTNWAKLQKQMAYDNTLVKAKKEKEEIWNLADVQGEFEQAQEQVKTFQLHYRDFEDSLHIVELVDRINALIRFRDLEAKDYWSKNDPNVVMASVDSLIGAGSFTKARKLLDMLKYSVLRSQAVEKYKTLADAYCSKERKVTSQLYAKAQMQKDVEKKRQILQEAIAPLDRCLTEYPEYRLREKVLDNKDFLQREISK